MKMFVDVPTVYLCTEVVDFRKSIKGRDKLKLLYWDNTGFALWYKRLDKHKFKWPKLSSPTMHLNEQQLHWLLSGYDVIGHSKIDVRGKQIL